MMVSRKTVIKTMEVEPRSRPKTHGGTVTRTGSGAGSGSASALLES